MHGLLGGVLPPWVSLLGREGEAGKRAKSVEALRGMANSSKFRRGEVGGWRAELSADDVAYMRATAATPAPVEGDPAAPLSPRPPACSRLPRVRETSETAREPQWPRREAHCGAIARQSSILLVDVVYRKSSFWRLSFAHWRGSCVVSSASGNGTVVCAYGDAVL